MCWSQSVSENVRPPDFWNAFCSLEHIEFQWKAPTVTRSPCSSWPIWDFGLKRVSSERLAIPFPSPTRETSFIWYSGFVGISNCVAWVSLLQNSWDCVLELWDVTHRRGNSSLDISLPERFALGLSCIIWIPIPWVPRNWKNIHLNNWSNHSSSWDCGINFGIWNSTRVCVLSACWRTISKTIIHVWTGRVAHTFQQSLFQNDASSQTFVYWMPFPNVSKFWRHSRNPDAGSSLLGVRTKEFTSCGFTFFSNCSFSFAGDLSEVGSCSFGLWPNSSHQLLTAPWILSWFGEWIVRNTSSVFEASALDCMTSRVQDA